jgi:hypothetical protein
MECDGMRCTALQCDAIHTAIQRNAALNEMLRVCLVWDNSLFIVFEVFLSDKLGKAGRQRKSVHVNATYGIAKRINTQNQAHHPQILPAPSKHSINQSMH